MVQTIIDILGLNADERFYAVLMSCLFLFIGVQYFFSLCTVPINMITNAFERMVKR